ncbi:chondroitin proteoglycan-2 [Drosophila innubila]|uniref:chondroitin proteoglycan-2 n=1 Tax=Drosophila innubila TaxID=198719 RepID=UPI00148E34A9|nr:chondroitin proteoglycan-2 [Drosophila innubila]
MCKLKGIAFLCLLFALGVQSKLSQWSDICAFETDGTRLPLPLDCKRFVLCLEREVAEIRSCPRGLHFNPKLGECDFQWRADCSGLSLYATTDNDEDCACTCCADECSSSEPTDPTPPCNPEEETTNSNEEESTTDSSIVTESPEEASTGTFDTDPSDSSSQTPPIESSTQSPNPSDSTSQSPPAESSTPQSPPVPSSTSAPSDNQVPAYCADKRAACANQPDGAMVPVEGVCTNYFQCSHGCCKEFICPGGLYFNFKTNNCDYFWNVQCEPLSSPDAGGEIAGPSGTTCTSSGVCEGKRDGMKFADPDSNGYFVCQCQCPIAMTCDPKTTFNQEAQVCDWDTSVICPDGLVYNATSKQCDYPEGYVPQVECDNDSTVCQGQPDGTLMPIDGVCNKFYKCSFNCAVEKICPNNLVYDPATKICDYPQNVDCPWPYTPPSGPNAGPSGISCVNPGRCLGQREGTFLPSLTSCSGYSVCQCECEIEMQCKQGLYWDSVLKTCNYESNVKCDL